MARRAPPQAVTARMYRHFALLTVAVTLVVGVFADGESRKAVASEIEAASRPKAAGSSQLVRKDGPPNGHSAGDSGFDGVFGAPTDTTGAIANDGIVPGDFAPESERLVPAGFSQYGVSAEVWATLTDDQKKSLIARRKAERAAAQAPERATQIDSLLAASRERSGEATTAD